MPSVAAFDPQYIAGIIAEALYLCKETEYVQYVGFNGQAIRLLGCYDGAGDAMDRIAQSSSIDT